MYKNIIKDLPKICEKTKINYGYKAEKCTKLGIDILSGEDDIIEKINNLEGEKKNSILDYINICVVIRRAKNIPYNSLIVFRDKLRAKFGNELSEVNVKLLEEKLPSVKDLVDYTNKLYENEDYQSYIINYLLIKLNCRVTDIDSIISKKQLDNKSNFLVLKKDKVTLIRNIYKTKEVYDTKVNEFIDEKLIDSCKKMIGKEKNVFLLSTSDGSHTTNPSMFIKTKLYNKMSPTKYFKIAVLETDKNDLILMENKRGTAVKTILKSYNAEQKFE
jgi:hypothetical protein